jgi:iron complex outermembrane receptor protein
MRASPRTSATRSIACAARRPNVTLGSGVTVVPKAPDNDRNFAQPWTYSYERDTFGSVRGEYDITPDITAWAAAGARSSYENNSLAGATVSNGLTGASTMSRFDNTREDKVKTAEIGIRGKLRTGSVGHEWVIGYSYFDLEKKNAYALGLGPGGTLATNIYNPRAYRQTALTFLGNDLASPALNGTTTLNSLAIGDTLSFMDDRLRLTLGARRQTIETSDIGFRVVSNGVQTAAGGDVTSYDQSRTSPLAGIVFKASNELSVYANYIEGLAQGESAPAQNAGQPVLNAGQQLRPYVSKQKEVGRQVRRRPRWAAAPGVLLHRAARAFQCSGQYFGRERQGPPPGRRSSQRVRPGRPRACACLAA